MSSKKMLSRVEQIKEICITTCCLYVKDSVKNCSYYCNCDFHCPHYVRAALLYDMMGYRKQEVKDNDG